MLLYFPCVRTHPRIHSNLRSAPASTLPTAPVGQSNAGLVEAKKPALQPPAGVVVNPKNKELSVVEGSQLSVRTNHAFLNSASAPHGPAALPGKSNGEHVNTKIPTPQPPTGMLVEPNSKKRYVEEYYESILCFALCSAQISF